MLKYWAFRIAAMVVPVVPMWIARPIAIVVGALLWLLAGPRRRRAEANLRHVPSLAEDEARLQWAVRGVFRHMALNYLDFFRGAYQTPADVLRGWTVENQEAVDAAVAQGHGLVVIGAHIGNFEQASSRLGALSYPSVAPAERMRPEPVWELFRGLREHHGLHLVPADSRDAVRALTDALKRGELAVFMADRYVAGASAEVPFFGEPARLPITPFTLAYRTGAPVVCAFSWREGARRAHGIFIPITGDEVRGAVPGESPASRSARADRSAGAARLQRAYLDALERVIEAHPEQWVATLNVIWEPQQTLDATAEVEAVGA